MATLQELQIRLAEAQSALHNALIGRSVTEVRDFNGERVVYSKADTTALRGYIRELEVQIAALLETPLTTGPMRIFL